MERTLTFTITGKRYDKLPIEVGAIVTNATTAITFAKTIADNIVKETSSDYSINPLHRVSNGVYTRIYSQENIKSTK